MATASWAITRPSRMPSWASEGFPDPGHLRAESLVPTHDVSPEFGATIQPDKRESRVYDIWEDGVVVQSVSLEHDSGRWGIGGYGGCTRPDPA